MEIIKENAAREAMVSRFIILTGAQKAEILKDRWRNLDWENRRPLSSRQSPGKARYVDLPDEVIQILKDIPDQLESEWLFPGRDKMKPVSDIYLYWDGLRRKIGCGDMQVEDLRSLWWCRFGQYNFMKNCILILC